MKGTIKHKKEQVRDSLFGTMTPHQIELIRDCWEHIVFLEKSLVSLDAKIDEHLKNYRSEYELLQTSPVLISHGGDTYCRDRCQYGPIPHRGKPGIMGWRSSWQP